MECVYCGKPILGDGMSISTPNGPAHLGECAEKELEAIRDEYEEAYDYQHIHES